MKYFSLTPLLDSEVNMETTVRNGSKNDDGTDAIAGVNWFLFGGIPAATLYVNGNNWIGFGVSSPQLNICNQDGAIYVILRQEGEVLGHKFLKLRVRGYTRYNSTDDQYRLVYEIFLLDNGNIFLNVIATPTNTSYLGTSSLVCDGITTALTITTPTQISLYANDEAGKKWAIQYEQLIVTPGFTLRWLLRQNDVLYTASEDGTLISLEGQAPTGALFRERGVETPSLTALATLATAELLCWTDSVDYPPSELCATLLAVPFPQDICTDKIPLNDATVKGIRNMDAITEGNVLFAVRFDEGPWLFWNSTQKEWSEAPAHGGVNASQLYACLLYTSRCV